MIFEAGTVEGHARDARALRLLGDAFADELRRLDVAAVLDLSTHIRFDRGRGGQHLAARLVDDLGVDVTRRAVHAQAVGLQADNFPPDMPRPARAWIDFFLSKN